MATQQLHLVVAPAPPASLLPPGAAVDNRPEPDTDAITRQFARVMGAGEGDLAVDPSLPPPSNLGAPSSVKELRATLLSLPLYKAVFSTKINNTTPSSPHRRGRVLHLLLPPGGRPCRVACVTGAVILAAERASTRVHARGGGEAAAAHTFPC